MRIRYELEPAAWSRFPAQVEDAVSSPEVRSVCEVGGGARPALSAELVERTGVRYAVADISAEELAKARGTHFERVQVDLASPAFSPPGTYDFIFSKMLVEHVESPERFHRNVLAMLAPGGRAFHFFPTLYSPPLLVNHLLPEAITERMLQRVQPGMRDPEGDHGKFRTYYRWCRGPSARQFARFESLGYEVEEYVGFFGHAYYARVLPLQRANAALARALVRRPVPALTTYAHLVLRRP